MSDVAGIACDDTGSIFEIDQYVLASLGDSGRGASSRDESDKALCVAADFCRDA
jgi:hypothetical protein